MVKSLILRSAFAFFISIVSLLVESSALAEQRDPIRVILIADQEQQKSEILYSVLTAYLSDYRVEVRIRKPPAGSTLAQIDVARGFLSDQEALAALWIDHKAREVGVLAIERGDRDSLSPRIDNEHLLIRDLPTWSTSWRGDCESIAALVRAMLSPWLSRLTNNSSCEYAGMVVEALDTERPWSPPPPCPAPPPESLFFLSIRPAVETIFASQNRVPMLGGSASLGISFRQIVNLRFQAGFFSQSASKGQVRVDRYPLRVGPAAWLSFWRLGVGAATEMVIDFTSWTGPESRLNTGRDTETAIGFGGSLLLRFRMARGLYLQAEGGVDLYNRSMRYIAHGSSAFEFMPLQPRMAIGIVLEAPVPRRGWK